MPKLWSNYFQAESSNFLFIMKHIYNPTKAAYIQQSSAKAIGTTVATKIFMTLLLGVLLLVSGEGFGQTTTLYGPNRFNNLDNLYIETLTGQIELAPGTAQLRAHSATGNSAYNGYVAISSRTFNLLKGYTYTVSFSARAVDHNQGGTGNISVLRGTGPSINWNSSSASALGNVEVLKSTGTTMTTYSITFKANDTFNSQYLAIRLSTTGGNQSELYLDNLRIIQSCAPATPQVTSNGSCSTNVPITLNASGAVTGLEEYRWYTSATEQTPIANATGPQYTTLSLSETQVYYVSIYSTVTTCESVRVPVTASVGGLIKPSVSMTTGSCDSNGNETKVYTASGGSEGSYRWYSVAEDGTLTQLSNSNGLPISSSTLSRRTNSDKGNYAVKTVGSGCESDPAYFSVAQGYPTAPTNNANGVICGDQLTLRASGASFGESYNWYATADGETTFLGQGAILVTKAPQVSTVYSVSKINTASGCESTTKRIATITLSPVLQASDISGNATICQGSSVIYSVPNVTGATYAWTITPTTGFTSVPNLSNATSNQVTIDYPASTAYRGTLKVTVTSPCNSYTSELEVQASNNNVATGSLVEPINPVIGRPETYGFTSNIDDDLIVDIVWSYRRTNSVDWISTPPTTSRTFTFQAMPGDLNGVRAEIKVLNPEVNCITGLSATNTFFVGNDQIIPLPVELMFFKAQAQIQGVNLTWATASELDNKGFEVQVSTNARDFKVIGFVESKVGTTSMRQEYSFLDTKAVSGTRYYRLKQVDLDGTTSFSPIRAVALNSDNATVNAYPNPFDDAVVVTLNGTEARNVQVVLMDAMGKVLQQRTEETSGNSITVDMRSITTKGMYVLHVLDNDTKHTFKLMKR